MTMYNTTMVLFDGKYMTFYFMAIVMLALSVTIFEIFAKQIKCKKCLTLKLKVKVKEKNRTYTIRF